MCVVTRSTIGVDEGDHEDDVSIEISPSCLLPPCKQSRNLRDEMKVSNTWRVAYWAKTAQNCRSSRPLCSYLCISVISAIIFVDVAK